MEKKEEDEIKKNEENPNNFDKDEFFHSQNPEFHETNGPIGMKNSENDPEEYEHLKTIVSAFLNYQVDSLRDVQRMERDFKSIDKKYKERLSFNYMDRIEKIKKAIWQNYTFLLKIVQPYNQMFKMIKTSTGEVLIEPLMVQPKDIIKMRSTIKLFIRDWSIDGLSERKTTYEPILQELKNYFKDEKQYEKGISVLVPGAGLGRLMYEIAKLGFKSQGNEFSYYMLLCSNYVLNNTTKKNEYMIQPCIHSFSNVYSEEAPFKEIYIPDENLYDELIKTKTGEMSMVAGEFCHVYKDNYNIWDSVVTCFFLDTANNVIEYVETIHKIMKIGGIWINIGPLLYHYSEIENECSIELSWNELKHIIIGYGFEIRNEKEIKCTYSSVEDSMMQTIYRCIFFTAVKMK